MRDRVAEAFDYMRVEHLDTTDGFGFSLLCDHDTSMTCDTAFDNPAHQLVEEGIGGDL